MIEFIFLIISDILDKFFSDSKLNFSVKKHNKSKILMPWYLEIIVKKKNFTSQIAYYILNFLKSL